MFKIRASQAGKIMTNSRKKGELSKTTQSYLQEWLKESIYGQRKEIESKYLTKGIEVEEDAIELAGDHLGWFMPEKNERNFEDEYFTGTPDVILGDTVIDIKSPWDCFTFPLFDTEIPNKDYYYQLQVYMHLTGLKKAQLVYVLMDTPTDLYGANQISYENVDTKYRVKVFDIIYNQYDIQELQNRVEECRNYLNSLL
jgi:hypothetical protein